MVAAEGTVLALLAAGRSTRFGRSKLDEDLWGKPVGFHAVDALADTPFLARIAVTGDARLDYAARGLTVLPNRDPTRDQSSSLRLAAEFAVTAEADALLVVLADMPCVTAAHAHRLIAAAEGPQTVIASTGDGVPQPPALFGRARFDALLSVTGDHGARDLIRGARKLIAPAEDLIDIDTPEDLRALRLSRIGGGHCPSS